MRKYIIACSKTWFLKNNSNLIDKKKFLIIKEKKKLKFSLIKKINPIFIFFPHWNYKVPKNIFENYICVCFHLGRLPQNRGGSPIQNLILKNKKKTYINALKMINKIDAGPIFCKEITYLHGSLEEIFIRLSKQILKMINYIIKNNPKPIKQVGKINFFKRLKNNSEIKQEKNIKQIYNKVRMLDDDEYPRAFLMFGKFKLTMSRAVLKNSHLKCEVLIKKNLK